jgi:hypothetical protein
MSEKQEIEVISPKGEVTVQSKAELRKKMKETLKEIDKKLTKLHKGSNATYKAQPQFKMNELDGNTVNIQQTADVMYLIRALALMKRVQKEYEETAKELELVKYPVCLWFGVPVSAWIHDLSLRIGIVTNADTIQKLTVSRNKLETFLTEEDRLAITLREVADLMAK